MENYSKIYNQFVPYNLSVKLKELGFDEPCLCYFNKQDNNQLWQDLDSGYYRNSIVSRGNLLWGDIYDNRNVSAPLWQQAFDWFREKGYESEINRNIPEMESRGFKKYSFYIWSEKTNPRGNFTDRKLNSVDTYEEARQACLEKLIELYSKD